MSNHLSSIVRELLLALGEDPAREGLQQTPDRVAKFYAQFFNGVTCDFTTFDAEGMQEMIVVGKIPFYSLCEHHLLPFFGTATVGYLPSDRILGLSKLPRAVQSIAGGLQNQERITQTVADRIVDAIHPRGVGVVLHARHLCMEMRGIKVTGATTTTTAFRGVFTNDTHTHRREFLDRDSHYMKM